MGLEQTFLQQPDLAGIKAMEAADFLDTSMQAESCLGDHGGFSQIIAII
jgi:hypothetical protein